MYVQREIWIEDICYDSAHIQKVLQEISKNFEVSFPEFIDSTGGNGISYAKLAALQKNWGLVQGSRKTAKKAQKRKSTKKS